MRTLLAVALTAGIAGVALAHHGVSTYRMDVVETLDGEEFLAINGVQTLSHGCCNLIREARELSGLGVRALRLSPHTCDMVAVAGIFRDVLDGKCDPERAMRQLRALFPGPAFINGFARGAAGALYV